MKKTLALVLALLLLCGTALADAPVVSNATPLEATWTLEEFENHVNKPVLTFDISEAADVKVYLHYAETGNIFTKVYDGHVESGSNVIEWDFVKWDGTHPAGGTRFEIFYTVEAVNADGTTTATTALDEGWFANWGYSNDEEHKDHLDENVDPNEEYTEEDGEKVERGPEEQKMTWYNSNTVNSFGPCFEGSWMTYSVIDLTVEGTQSFDLVAAGAWHLGTVNVTVQGDTVTVDYICTEDINAADVWDEVYADREWFTIFGDLDAVTTLNPDEIGTSYTFGEPISIANDLGGDTVVILYVNNAMTYSHDNPYVTRFWPNVPANKAIVEAMTVLLAD